MGAGVGLQRDAPNEEESVMYPTPTSSTKTISKIVICDDFK